MLLEYTKGICPVCKVVVDAELNVREDEVFSTKRRRSHGRLEALVYSDARLYADSLRFNRPGALPLATQTEVHDGCPLDRGLCPDHEHHARLGIIEVNSDCNLHCPVCFADPGHRPDGFSLSLGQVEAGLDAFVAAEGEPEVVMCSGGEPSIHPRILECCAMARGRRFAPARAELGVRISLLFDGVEEPTHLAMRGRDLRRAKQAALDRCAEAGPSVVLVAAVERGVDDHELGAVVRHGIAHPAVRGAALQPVTHAGRTPGFVPRRPLTNADVIHALVEQCPGRFEIPDFFPVPCCFPTRRSVTYLLADEDDVLPLPRLLPLESYLDDLTDRALPGPALREALDVLWSASAVPGGEGVAERLRAALGALGMSGDLGQVTEAALSACVGCGVDPPAALDTRAAKAFMIVVQDFQDPYTLDVRQLMKCCVEEITRDGRLIPFCAYDSVACREEVREQLSGEPVTPIVPRRRTWGSPDARPRWFAAAVPATCSSPPERREARTG